MGLIDHQVRLPRLADAGVRDAPRCRARGKDIVVIADDDVRLLGAVELQFERADPVLFAQVAKGAGLQLPFPCQDSEDALIVNLCVVIAGILTVVGIAERLVLEADLALGGDGEGLDGRPRLLKTADRVLGHRVLAVFRRDVDHSLAPAQRLLQHRIEDPDGLSRARWGPE